MRIDNMNKDQFEVFLEDALKRVSKAPADDTAAAERVLKRLAGPLPRQKFALWRLPTVLLDWQFAPAWPRVAALACCAALGFSIGIAGIDRQFVNDDAVSSYVGGGGLGLIAFEPDPFPAPRS